MMLLCDALLLSHSQISYLAALIRDVQKVTEKLIQCHLEEAFFVPTTPRSGNELWCRVFFFAKNFTKRKAHTHT